MPRIVLGFNGSAESKDALRLAGELADVLDAELVVGCAYPYQPLVTRLADGEYERFLASEAEIAAAEARGLLADRPRTSVEVVAAHSPSRALHELAEREGAQLVVLGSTHRARPGSILPGGTAQQLLHGAPCSVAIAPSEYRLREHAAIHRIGAAFDGSPESAEAVATAAALARAAHGSLEIERVVWLPEPSEEHLLPAFRAELEATLVETRAALEDVATGAADGIEVIERLVQANPTSELVRWSGELDLLALGSRSYGPLRQILLGSTSAELIRWAQCPVLVLPRGVERPLYEAAAHRAASAA